MAPIIRYGAESFITTMNDKILSPWMPNIIGPGEYHRRSTKNNVCVQFIPYRRYYRLIDTNWEQNKIPFYIWSHFGMKQFIDRQLQSKYGYRFLSEEEWQKIQILQ